MASPPKKDDCKEKDKSRPSRDKYTDVTFNIRGTKISAHMVVLAHISKKFDAMFDNQKDRGDMSNLELDYDPFIFETMIDYLYDDGELSTSSLDEAIQLFIIADNFMLDDLKDSAEVVILSKLGKDAITTFEKLPKTKIFDRVRKKCDKDLVWKLGNVDSKELSNINAETFVYIIDIITSSEIVGRYDVAYKAILGWENKNNRKTVEQLLKFIDFYELSDDCIPLIDCSNVNDVDILRKMVIALKNSYLDSR